MAALGSFLFTRHQGGDWRLRIDDLDTNRVIPGMERDIIATLESLGFEWDGAIVRQSERTEAYREAFEQLTKLGSVYPCGCSRREISQLATAPHDGEEGEIPYPGICSQGLPPGKSPRAYRLRVPRELVSFRDLIQGDQTFDMVSVSGDFVVRRADGIFSYQLATVVDDHFLGVTQVVRGCDLLSSTPRQIILQRLLGLATPDYAHLPLVRSPDGGKLSKRDAVVSVSRHHSRRSASSLLANAARFLGIELPAETDRLPPREILGLSLSLFDPSRLRR